MNYNKIKNILSVLLAAITLTKINSNPAADDKNPKISPNKSASTTATRLPNSESEPTPQTQQVAKASDTSVTAVFSKEKELPKPIIAQEVVKALTPNHRPLIFKNGCVDIPTEFQHLPILFFCCPETGSECTVTFSAFAAANARKIPIPFNKFDLSKSYRCFISTSQQPGNTFDQKLKVPTELLLTLPPAKNLLSAPTESYELVATTKSAQSLVPSSTKPPILLSTPASGSESYKFVASGTLPANQILTQQCFLQNQIGCCLTSYNEWREAEPKPKQLMEKAKALTNAYTKINSLHLLYDEKNKETFEKISQVVPIINSILKLSATIPEIAKSIEASGLDDKDKNNLKKLLKLKTFIIAKTKKQAEEEAKKEAEAEAKKKAEAKKEAAEDAREQSAKPPVTHSTPTGAGTTGKSLTHPNKYRPRQKKRPPTTRKAYTLRNPEEPLTPSLLNEMSSQQANNAPTETQSANTPPTTSGSTVDRIRNLGGRSLPGMPTVNITWVNERIRVGKGQPDLTEISELISNDGAYIAFAKGIAILKDKDATTITDVNSATKTLQEICSSFQRDEISIVTLQKLL